MTFFYALAGNIIIGICLVFLILILNNFKDLLTKYVDYITAITVGMILGIVFLGFLPELIIEGIDGTIIGYSIISGLIIFYILEIFLHHHHCKDLGSDEHKKNHEKSILMFIGTFIHNLLHGLVLFSAFAININFGISVCIAVLLHSIPQNTVNYIMNHNNVKIVLLAAIGGVIGTLLLFPFVNLLLEYKLYILGIIGGGLLYIALSDILPEFKINNNIKNKIIYLLLIIFGIFLIYLNSIII